MTERKTSRRSTVDGTDDLFVKPSQWTLLAAWNRLTANARASGDPSRGPVFLRGCTRIEQAENLELSGAVPAEEGEPAELVVVCKQDLVGPDSPLPDDFTDWLARAQAPALADFLDLFNNSFLRLYPEAAAAAAFPSAAGTDRLAARLRSVLGAVGGSDIPFDPRIYHFASYARRTRPLAALAEVLADYFDLPVAAAEAPGRWVSLTEEEAAVLMAPAVFEVDHCSRITLGPARWRDRLRHFIPRVGKAFGSLVRLSAEYLGPHRLFEVELVLHPDDPGPDADDPAADDLNWSVWLTAGGDRRGLISSDACLDFLRSG